ncbi:MAG: aminotransferase class IV, partial [Candidatus Marinimicrobia bacterium]|nr:aminotransferase class IV [Candidatus Neomarinimicrobiota bacterium]
FRPPKHLERMRDGMATLEIEFPVTEKEIVGLLEEMIRRNHLTESTLRLMLTRGTLPGAPFTFSGPANLYIGLRYTQPEPPFPVKVVFASESDYPIARRSPAVKSMTYLWNMLAIRDATRQGAFEPVFVNGEGLITECAVRNIFFIDGDILRTPDLSLGILQGVTRDLILELAPALGLSIDSAPITREAANGMDEAFIASTGIGVYPVTWDGYDPRDYPRTIAIREAVENQVRIELGG